MFRRARKATVVNCRSSIQFLPEALGRPNRVDPQFFQIGFGFCEHEGASSVLEGLLVSVHNRVARVFKFDIQGTEIDGDLRAGGEANQIIRVSQRMRLIEVVASPTEPALGIPPGTKTSYVKVPDRQYFWSAD